MEANTLCLECCCDVLEEDGLTLYCELTPAHSNQHMATTTINGDTEIIFWRDE